MRFAVLATIAVLLLIALDASSADQYGSAAWRSLKALYENGEICLTGPCDLAAGTTVGGAPIGGGGVSDGDKGDVTVSGSGATWTVDSGAVAFSELSGTAADSQIPNNITIDLATTATTANAGDSATAFFSSGTLEGARGGVGTALPTCSGTDKLTANGSVVSCATDETGGGGGAGYAEIAAAALAGL